MQNDLRFTILLHELPDGSFHWDFLLEISDNEKLATWACVSQPGGKSFSGCKIFNHRPVYLDYEGEISGNRGTVTQYDTGTYAPALSNADIESRRFEIELRGEKLQGRYQAKAEDTWTFSYI